MGLALCGAHASSTTRPRSQTAPSRHSSRQLPRQHLCKRRHRVRETRDTPSPLRTFTHPPTMVHKVLLWGGLGVAARLWQLGIEMRPLFSKESLWVYPVFAGIGGSFGYWLMGVEQRQFRMLADRRDALIEKRARRREREAAARDS
ncbi:hypothetical protein NX059_010789 [Plenodomus lindquistii]|nr:hypothetical protein NX059_010789 [Plenodomus lindquistii]